MISFSGGPLTKPGKLAVGTALAAALLLAASSIVPWYTVTLTEQLDRGEATLRLDWFMTHVQQLESVPGQNEVRAVRDYEDFNDPSLLASAFSALQVTTILGAALVAGGAFLLILPRYAPRRAAYRQATRGILIAGVAVLAWGGIQFATDLPGAFAADRPFDLDEGGNEDDWPGTSFDGHASRPGQAGPWEMDWGGSVGWYNAFIAAGLAFVGALLPWRDEAASVEAQAEAEAIALLKSRLARGEIDEAEYARKVKLIR